MYSLVNWLDSQTAPTAVVLGVQLPGVSDAEFASSLAELKRLASTLGVTIAGSVTQKRPALAKSAVIGEGKLKELAKWTGGKGEVTGYQRPGSRGAREALDAELAEAAAQADQADDDADSAEDLGAHRAQADDPGDASSDAGDARGTDADALADDANAAAAHTTVGSATVVLVDHELSPTQQRNLEKATGVDVLDRTSVILEIFSRHAKTREARMQVEIAKLGYLAPRLRESAGNEDRVRGGVGGKGAGESSLELDRRRIRDRIAELRRELANLQSGANVRRMRRSALPTVALVGYTNAGKSSLMRALTGSEVYVANKLFATLDTTVRTLSPPTEPTILISDTVGFIKKLPHDLVASFRSTLDEANQADLLLHVLDASDPAMESQLHVTKTVLAELGADNAPAKLILNKIDLCSPELREELAVRYPDAIAMSAVSRDDVAQLRLTLVALFAGAMEEATLMVPWAKHGLVASMHERGYVVSTEHNDDGTQVLVKAPKAALDALRAELTPP